MKTAPFSLKVVFGQNPQPRLTPMMAAAGLVLVRRFETEAEEQAYRLALSDAQGHLHSLALQPPFPARVLTVCATATTSDLHPLDVAVAGFYSVVVPASLSPAQAASAALDGFHCGVPVKVLENFEFGVYDEAGRPVAADPDVEEGALWESCFSVEKLDTVPPALLVDCFGCQRLVFQGQTLRTPGEPEFCPECVAGATKVVVEDGGVFELQADGSWSDGARTFPNLAAFDLSFLIMEKLGAGDPSPGWRDEIAGMSARDWQLYADDPGADEAARALSLRLVEHLDRVLELEVEHPGRKGLRYAKAKDIRDLMYTNMDEHIHLGARDTEPEGVLVDVVNRVLGTDIGRWD